MRSHLRIAGYWLLFFMAGCVPCVAQAVASDAGKKTDLTAMNIEDLMNIKVTSVSKTEQKLSRTASAVFVIEREDIRRSGALNIPDLLRMVPGVNVAQISSNAWAISVRGINSRFSNKLLVMLDGRPVYSPSFGGVFWDVLDVPLEDIERIEVIRGPGGSVWGANAVNGVINIITGKASETHGGLVTFGGGNINQGFGTIQYGGTFYNKKIDYRIYSKYLNQGHLPNGAGQNGGDAWHLLQGGFRTDATISSKDTLTVQGNMYTGGENNPTEFLLSNTFPNSQTIDAHTNVSGGYLQSVWNHVFSPRSDTSLNMSYDTYRRNDILPESRNTLIVDFQHHIQWGNRQNIIWGVAYRFSTSRSQGNFSHSFSPASASDPLFSSFIQDEFALVPDRLYLTVGTQVERNSYTGWAAMPSARLAWQASKRNMFWAAFSSPIRTPHETDVAIRAVLPAPTGPGGIPIVISLTGNPAFQNEKLNAYEAGYRTTISDKLSIDLAAYYNVYKNLQTVEPGVPVLVSNPPPGYLLIPETFQNLMHGETHGLEISTNWKLFSWWSLSPGYAFELVHLRPDPASQDFTSVALEEGSSPRHSAQLRSRIEFPFGVEWNSTAYFTDRLTAGNLPAYTRLDTQVSWKWRERGSISLVGQNLLSDHHFEFQDFAQTILANQMKRSGYVQVSWRF